MYYPMKKHHSRNFSGRLQYIAHKLKLRTWISLGILLILTPVILLSLFHSQKADAAWFNDSWAFRKKIPITAHTAAETNKYFSVTVDTSDTTKFQADCGDIRFTDNTGTLLQYYISSGCSGASTVLHVNVPTFPAGATDYYMYYGNPNVANGFSAADFTAGTSVTVGTVGSEEKGTAALNYWSFDEGYSTTAHDNSGNQNSGTLGGTTVPVWQSEDLCVSGKCLYFDGSSSKVTGSVTMKNVQTVSFWIRPNTIATRGIINLDGGTHKINTNGSGVVSAASFTSPTYYLNGRAVSTLTLVANQWNYVTITTGTGFDSTSSFTVGTDGTNFIKGTIDEVKFYNYARTASQVQAGFNSFGDNDGVSAGLGGTNQKYLSDGLAGYWKLDESASPAVDSAGNGNSATWVNSPSATGGKFGSAVSLNGTTQGLSLATQFSAVDSAFTISAWIYSTSLASTRAIFGTTTGNRFWFHIETDGSLSLCNDTGSGCTTLSSNTGVITTNTWYHVVLTHDGSLHYRFYVNGVDKTNVGTATSATAVPTSGEYIGASQVAAFAGRIDEFRIYTKALSSSEVKALYNWAAGPIGYWKLDESSGTSAYDSSATGGTGTLGGGAMPITGKYGGALQGVGKTSQYVQVSDNNIYDFSSTTSFSLTGWVRVTSDSQFSNPQQIATHGNADQGTQNGFGLVVRGLGSGCAQAATGGTSVCIRIADGTNKYVISTNSAFATDGVWHYVTAVIDRSSESNSLIYIDGVAQAVTREGTFASIGSLASTHTLCLLAGSNATCDTSTAEYVGLDDFKIYTYARTPQQIIEDMNAGHPTGGSPFGTYTSYWKMDEANGTTAHDANSINQNDLTLSTATSAWNTLGKVNAMWVGAGTNWLSRADDADFDLAAADDASISMWFKSTSASNPAATQYLFTKGGPSSVPGYALYATTSGTVCFGIDDDTTWGPDDSACSTADIYDATWHHVVAEKTGTTEIRLYVDGKSVGSDTTIAATSTLANSSTMYVGDDNGNSTNSFAGNIDEVKFYRAALTQDQVLLDMNSGSAVNYGTGQNEATQITGSAETAPVGYWNLDEGTGTNANDTSGNNLTGTLTNGPTWATGKIGSGVTFDGSNDYITVTHNAVLNTSSAFTVETWIKFTNSVTSLQDIIFKGIDTAGVENTTFFLQQQTSGKIETGFTTSGSGFTFLDSTNTLSLNTWYHIVGTYSAANNRLRIYINGRLDNSGSAGGFTPDTNASPLLFGVGNTSSLRPFRGILDDVKVYNYERTPAQIAYDYNRGGPVGWWKLDECQGGTAYDASGNGNNATITVGGSGTQTSVGTCATSSTAWGNGATGKFNSGINFDGTDDYAAFSTTDSTLTSISFWFKLISSTSNLTLLELPGFKIQPGFPGSTCNGCIRLFSHRATTDGEWHTADSRITTGVWYHLVVTYDSSSVSNKPVVYLNGAQLDDFYLLNNYTAPVGTATSNTGTSNIGRSVVGGNDYSNALVDDLRIYNYLLSSSQVKKIYNNGSSVFFGPVQGTPVP